MGGTQSSKESGKLQVPAPQPIPNPQPEPSSTESGKPQGPATQHIPEIPPIIQPRIRAVIRLPPSQTKISDGNNLCGKIEKLITPYIDLARSQPVQNIGVPLHILANSSGGQIPILRLSAFVDLANGALQSNTNFRLPYIESIYKMADMKHSCNGIIVLKYTYIDTDGYRHKYERDPCLQNKFKPYFYFNFDGGAQKIYVPVRKDINEPGLYLFQKTKTVFDTYTYDRVDPHTIHAQYTGFLKEKFTDKFLAQYNNHDCNFISIAVNLLPLTGGHANMLLVYKGEHKVYIMLYEPHGAQGVQVSNPQRKPQYDQMNTEFIDFMIALINSEEKKIRGINARNVVKVDSYNISANVGIQSYMKDRNGYCYMITAFWLYIILIIIKDNSFSREQEEKFILNLNYIEECVFSIVETEINKDKESAEVPQASTDPTVLKPVQQGSLKGYNNSQVLNSLIVHFSYDFLIKFYLDYFNPDNPLYKIFTESFKTFYKQEVGTEKFYKEIFIQYITADDIVRLYKPDQQRMERQAVEISKFMADGFSCKENKECLSYKCNDKNKCEPRTYEATQSSQGSIPDESEDEESKQPTGHQDQPICIQRKQSVSRQVKDLLYEPFQEKVRVDEEYNDERFSVISPGQISVNLQRGIKRGAASELEVVDL